LCTVGDGLFAPGVDGRQRGVDKGPVEDQVDVRIARALTWIKSFIAATPRVGRQAQVLWPRLDNTAEKHVDTKIEIDVKNRKDNASNFILRLRIRRNRTLASHQEIGKRGPAGIPDRLRRQSGERNV
jgi:hypothetical protein